MPKFDLGSFENRAPGPRVQATVVHNTVQNLYGYQTSIIITAMPVTLRTAFLDYWTVFSFFSRSSVSSFSFFFVNFLFGSVL